MNPLLGLGLAHLNRAAWRLAPLPIALTALLLAASGGVAGQTSASTSANASTELRLSYPRGGWNAAGLTDKSEHYQSAYPANLINRGRLKNRAMIRGAIAKQSGQRRLTLVVNGGATPLAAGSGNEFARPYAFSPGSNSVEIRDDKGNSLKRVQWIEQQTQLRRAKIRAVLSWDDSQAEIDMHVLTPDGQHAFYGNPTLRDGGGLEADGVDGPGPEMLVLQQPMSGLYQIYVNYWGNFSESGYHFDESTRQKPVTTAQVTLIFSENTVNERREHVTVPLRKIGDLILVKQFIQ